MCDLEDLQDEKVHNDAPASWMELAWENSLSAPY
jgi:hypothetical protein